MKKAFKFLIFTYIITTNSPSLAYHVHVTVNMIAEKNLKLSDTKNFRNRSPTPILSGFCKGAIQIYRTSTL